MINTRVICIGNYKVGKNHDVFFINQKINIFLFK